jgi:hypothetical protein
MIRYEPKLRDIQAEADWDHASLRIDNEKKIASIFIPKLRVRTGGLTLTIGQGVDSFPLVENRQTPSKLFRSGWHNMYYEVLDVAQKVFVIGFK